jgi:peptide/nickel transport system substrate-binding protein
VPGGTLRVGASGGSSGDTLDAHNILSNADFPRMAQLYDPLARLTPEAKPELVLAESITPNKTATKWIITLRKGVLFHDGKPFTADDVVFSFKRIVQGEFAGKFVLGPINLNQTKALDKYTVQVAFSSPYAVFYEALAGRFEYMYMVPVGYNPKKPIGTGPFKLVNWSPGRESVTKKFDDYWDHPKPYLDEIRTIDIGDETAQVSGLQSGQLDAVDFLAAGSIATLESSSGVKVLIGKTGGWSPFAMRVDKTPFSDRRVREALKLSVDRPQMIESLFAGNGMVGNDFFSPFDPAVKTVQLPQRSQDLEKAKSLLAQAGYPGLGVELFTAPLSPGMVGAASIFATQAAGAGVKTKVVAQTSSDYFARTYAKAAFSLTYWQYLPYLTTVSQATLKGAPFNETYFDDPKYNSLYQQAISTLDEKKRTEIIHEMLQIDWEESGYIIPYFYPVIDGLRENVHGVVPAVTGQSLSNFQFQNFWMS